MSVVASSDVGTESTRNKSKCLPLFAMTTRFHSTIDNYIISISTKKPFILSLKKIFDGAGKELSIQNF